MIVPTPISRRRFLVGVLGFGATTAFIGTRPWRALVRTVDGTLAERFAALFTRRESAGAVGHAYLAHAPEEASLSELVDAIVARLPGGRAAVLGADQAELRRLVAARIDEDFAQERVVEVAGWLLSSTEARLYAVAALA